VVAKWLTVVASDCKWFQFVSDGEKLLQDVAENCCKWSQVAGKCLLVLEMLVSENNADKCFRKAVSGSKSYFGHGCKVLQGVASGCKFHTQ
jgi:hypothetical protein